MIAAGPLLKQAHHNCWQVREQCHDEAMMEQMLNAMVFIQEAQQRLEQIAKEAREIKT